VSEWNYSPVVRENPPDPLPADHIASWNTHNCPEMAALRSRPVAIKPIRNPRTGSLSYRVLGQSSASQFPRRVSLRD
jgi:hypothetical protein